jgi:hypothetical protein
MIGPGRSTRWWRRSTLYAWAPPLPAWSKVRLPGAGRTRIPLRGAAVDISDPGLVVLDFAPPRHHALAPVRLRIRVPGLPDCPYDGTMPAIVTVDQITDTAPAHIRLRAIAGIAYLDLRCQLDPEFFGLAVWPPERLLRLPAAGQIRVRLRLVPAASLPKARTRAAGSRHGRDSPESDDRPVSPGTGQHLD